MRIKLIVQIPCIINVQDDTRNLNECKKLFSQQKYSHIIVKWLSPYKIVFKVKLAFDLMTKIIISFVLEIVGLIETKS